MGLITRSIDVKEFTSVRGRMQATLWDAEAEALLLDDPERLFFPHLHQQWVLRIDPWRDNKVVANEVAGSGNGLNLLRDFLRGSNPPYPTHVAWGTNGTAPSLGDQGLYAERARTNIIAGLPGDKQLTYAGFMGSTVGNGETFQEAALVTGPLSAAWRIFARIAMNPIAKNVNVLISVNWDILLA